LQSGHYKTLAAAIAKALTPPPDLTVSQWADTSRKLSSEASAEAGQWNTNRAPYQRGMMDAVNDPSIETVCIMSSAQIGKTELLNNVVGYYIDHDPAPLLVLQPTLAMSEAWSKDRLAPMLRDCPTLRDKVQDPKSRNSGNTLLHKTFAGGHITMAGANSPASLASRPIRIVLCDEVDRYPSSAGTEGDPVSLAKKRTATFWNRKIILTSTPTVKHESRIEAEFEKSDKRRYFMPCPHCDFKQIFKWSNIVFDKENLDEDVYYSCENGCVIEEKDKHKMLARGEWIAECETRGRAGFHLNELYSPWRKWREVVQDFLEAKDDPELLKTWTNTSMGETFEIKGVEIAGDEVYHRGEAYDEDVIPDGVLFLTAAVDTQGDRLEAQIYGWGENKERWVFPVKIFWGDAGKKEVWNDLDQWLLKTRGGLNKFKIACCLVDSGGHNTSEVYAFCKARQKRRVFAIKGSSQHGAPLVSKPSQVGKERAMLYSIGTVAGKDAVKSSLSITEQGAGYVHFSHDLDDEYFNQLVKSEVRRTKRIQGAIVGFYQQKRDRNEGLDLAVYNIAAYAVLDPNVHAIKKKHRASENAAPPEALEEEPQQIIPTPIIRRRQQKSRRGNFATTW
jgi:phage terminase large subunit GpA-like protein